MYIPLFDWRCRPRYRSLEISVNVKTQSAVHYQRRIFNETFANIDNNNETTMRTNHVSKIMVSMMCFKSIIRKINRKIRYFLNQVWNTKYI